MSTLKRSFIRNTPKRKALVLFSAFLVLVVTILISVCVGAANITVAELVKILITGEVDSSKGQILYYVRIPRTVAACLAGTALAVSGTILQTILNNPICSPSIIGVNAGAGLFMIITAAFFPTAVAFSPIAAFIGAVVAVAAVYLIARYKTTSKLTIVLSGIAVSSLLSALTDTIITLVPDVKVSRIDFLIGSFAGVTMDNVIFSLPYIVIGLVVVFYIGADINLLSLGDTAASSLGVSVGGVRFIALTVAALLAGSAISLAGLIGFVGLIVPHIAKLVIGYDHRFLFPLTAMLGGAFCLLCDILARVLFIPFEVPVGIVMALIGSPFFIFLILSRKRGGSFN